jgi:TRAP-type C4-dicarboxylate transport system permease small subunit
MDYFYRKFDPGMQRIIDLIITSVSAILFLLMSVYSVYFIVLGLSETSPSLGIPMSLAFVSMLVMSGSVLYYLLIQFIHHIKSEGK